jgi:hypothetical protein
MAGYAAKYSYQPQSVTALSFGSRIDGTFVIWHKLLIMNNLQ